MRFNESKSGRHKDFSATSPIEFLPLEKAEEQIEESKIDADLKTILIGLLRRIG